MRCSVLATGILTVLLATAALPHAAAHPAGVPDGYTRYAHDCSDDYGPHGTGINTETAHDGIAIDVIEKDAGLGDLLYIRISMSSKATTNNDETRETITFDSPGLDSAVQATVDSTDEESFDLVSSETSLAPKDVRGPLSVYNTDGSVDTARVGFEIGYNHTDLKVANGQQITNIELVTLHKGALTSSFTEADLVPGGTFGDSDDPSAGCDSSDQEADLFVAVGYTVQRSDYDDGSDDGPDDGGGPNDDAGVPVADFTFSPERPAMGETVTFTDASVDHDGDVVAWSWEFGDGATSTERHPSHTYDGGGSYVVRLTVTDDDGLNGTTTKDVSFANQRPSASFTISSDTIAADEPVTFTDTSTDPEGEITARAWDFGDGSTGEGETATHTYGTSGSYDVTLTVTDSAGARASTTHTVTVTEATDGGDTEAAPAPAFLLVLAMIALLGAVRRQS